MTGGLGLGGKTVAGQVAGGEAAGWASGRRAGLGMGRQG